MHGSTKLKFNGKHGSKKTRHDVYWTHLIQERLDLRTEWKSNGHSTSINGAEFLKLNFPWALVLVSINTEYSKRSVLVIITIWINWTNLMSLYEIFYCSTFFEWYYTDPQELATICGCVALFRCVVRSAPTCIRIPPYSSRTAPIQQYTPKQSNTPTYSRQLLRMSVIALETCWAIKNFHKMTSSWFNLFN